MKFIQLFASVMIALVPHCLAASAGSKDLQDGSDLIYNEQRAPSQSEAYDKVIQGQTLKYFCRNHGNLIPYDIGNCLVSKSLKIKGAHNCKGGRYYYCVTDKEGNGECLAIRKAKDFQMESGECFK